MALRRWVESGGNSGNWSQKKHWSGNDIPGTGDIVVLPALGKDYVVALDVNSASLEFLQLQSAEATLGIGAGRFLTVTGTDSAAINLGPGGHITMTTGSRIVDAGGFNVGSGSVIGAGIISVAGHYIGSGLLMAKGGTLELLGIIDFGPRLAIDTSAPSVLKLPGVATAALEILMESSNATLSVGGELTLVQPQYFRGGSHLVLTGGVVNGKGGIALVNGSTIDGAGKIVANLSSDGASTIRATGGTLELQGDLFAGGSLLIDKNSILKLGGTGPHETGRPVELDDPTKKLDVAGALTINIDERQVIQGTLNVDGLLTVPRGIQMQGGNLTGSGKLSGESSIEGYGIVTLNIEGKHSILAEGGFMISNVELVLNNASVVRLGTEGPEAHLHLKGNVTSGSLGFNFGGSTIVDKGATLHLTGDHQRFFNGLIDMRGGSLLVDHGFDFTGGSISGNGIISTGATGTDIFTGGGNVTAVGGL